MKSLVNGLELKAFHLCHIEFLDSTSILASRGNHVEHSFFHPVCSNATKAHAFSASCRANALEVFFVPICKVIAFVRQILERHPQSRIARPVEPLVAARTKQHIAVATTIDCSAHIVRRQGIERCIVHANHDVRGGRTAVGSRQDESPLLFLPGLQVVAECVPMHREPCVGLFIPEVQHTMLELAFVYEHHRDTQMMAEALFVWHFEHRSLV